MQGGGGVSGSLQRRVRRQAARARPALQSAPQSRTRYRGSEGRRTPQLESSSRRRAGRMSAGSRWLLPLGHRWEAQGRCSGRLRTLWDGLRETGERAGRRRRGVHTHTGVRLRMRRAADSGWTGTRALLSPPASRPLPRARTRVNGGLAGLLQGSKHCGAVGSAAVYGHRNAQACACIRVLT